MQLTSMVSKIHPKSNPHLAWCFIFVPALLSYLVFLMRYVNLKPTLGDIEIYVSEGQELFNKNSKIEIIVSGLNWSEGPVWIEEQSTSNSFLLFSDTRTNRISRWEEGKGLFTLGKTLYINNSGGCPQNSEWCSRVIEPGSNGILQMPDRLESDLIICEHGSRSLSVVFENGTKITLASHYNGFKLNSPNDLVMSRKKNLYFTDPPYGLKSTANDGQYLDKQLNFSGVYMISHQDLLDSMETGVPTSRVKLLDDSIGLPNGVGLSPDNRKLYVSHSGTDEAVWYVYDVDDEGLVSNRKVFFNGTSLWEKYPFGLADGFKVDHKGRVIASAPGGVIVLSAQGDLLAMLRLGKSVSNVAFGKNDEIFITAADTVLRVPCNTKATVYRY